MRIEKYFELIEVLEFDSLRKRMSVIVRHADTNHYVLYSKGADSEMFKKSTTNDHSHFETSLKEYSLQGWRTLVFAHKVLTRKEYETYSHMLSDARSDVLKRESRLNEAFDHIESDLILTGVTAVEDKLQENVEDTLKDLRAAGIKIWVLTGDKLETAVNISESCGHFGVNMVKFSLSNIKSSAELKENLKNMAAEIENNPIESFALVIDGETLGFVFEMNVQETFSDIAEKCKAVLCCRMSPSQKAEVNLKI